MKRLLFWIPALAWGCFIFVMSNQPAGPKPSWWFNHADKVIHGVFFGIFSLLILLALRKGHRLPFRRAALIAFAAATLYGSSDEIHQMFTPTRTPDWADLLADATGASLVFLGLLKPRMDTNRHE